MASIKTLLEKTMLKVGSTASIIDSTAPVSVVTDATESFSYTPADNGYLYVFGEGDENTSTPKKLIVSYSAGVVVSQIAQSNWFGLDVLSPVRKGNVVSITGLNLKSITARFYRLVGGA